ncbi:sensor histidine kinase [Streptomyces ossamyceticus]|uniref:GAF domain-containing sensor histidine kinase n=1 Tax=Streptomyces ossamyceticus TaxID=249581 RepID=A0ABV2UU84_9ACTN
MAVRVVVWSVVLTSVIAVALAGWARAALPAVPGQEQPVAEVALMGSALVSWAAAGAVLTVLRPRNPLGWLFLLIGGSGAWQLGLAAYGSHGATADRGWPGAAAVAAVAGGAHVPSLFALPTVVLALYPRGRLDARWLRWTVAAAAAGIGTLTVAAVFDPDAYDDIVPGRPPPVALPATVLGPLIAFCLLLIGLSALAVTAHALRRLVRSEPPERQQLAWMLSVLTVVMGTSFFAGPLVRAALAVLVPAAVAVGVLRYRMLGIEAVLRRGLVYGLLTTVVAALYLLTTAAIGMLWEPSPLPGVLAAAVVAVALTPARDRLQQAVDWWIYGARRDPLRALARLGDRVAYGDEEELLPGALDVVRHAVRAPSVRLTGPDGAVRATAGPPPAPGLTLPLRLAGRPLGTLTVADRAPGEPYGRDDLRLLEALAQQVAVIARALELTDLVAAHRDQVIEATRLERDRLRQDLHDGLGPSLAGMGLGLQATADSLDRGDTAAARLLLDRMRDEVPGAVGEIRRIIDDLRPDALDRMSLLEATRRHARTLTPAVTIDIAAPELPPLPPAVESSAYRIVTEALTNVARHADADRAFVRLTVSDHTLHITVTDDGRGLPPRLVPGVGLTSMRRRAEARGGSLTVRPGVRGTVLTAVLPLEAP